MYSRVRKVKGTIEVDPIKHRDTLLVCSGSCNVVVPPIDRSAGVTFGVLPRGKSRVTFQTSDGSAVLDPGNGPQTEFVVAGQSITDVVMVDMWLLTVGSGPLANVPEETPDVVSEKAKATDKKAKPEPAPKAKAEDAKADKPAANTEEDGE